MVLDEDGAVAVVCGMTGLTLWEVGAKWQPVKDMRLLQEEEGRAQFLFLLDDPESEGNLLRIVSFPGVCACKRDTDRECTHMLLLIAYPHSSS